MCIHIPWCLMRNDAFEIYSIFTIDNILDQSKLHPTTITKHNSQNVAIWVNLFHTRWQVLGSLFQKPPINMFMVSNGTYGSSLENVLNVLVFLALLGGPMGQTMIHTHNKHTTDTRNAHVQHTHKHTQDIHTHNTHTRTTHTQASFHFGGRISIKMTKICLKLRHFSRKKSELLHHRRSDNMLSVNQL